MSSLTLVKSMRRRRGIEPDKLVVGYAFMAKKMESMEKIIEISSKMQDKIVYKPLDLSKELHEQGNFDIILHKLSEDIMNRHSVHSSENKIALIERYLSKQKSCICLDPFQNVNVVINRISTLEVLENCFRKYGEGMPRPPKYIVVYAFEKVDDIKKRVRESSMRYPLICKPLKACGTQGSHNMLVVLDEASLEAVSVPIVIQEYYNHNETLFKVSVVGEVVQVKVRTSLPNLPDNLHGSLTFDSQKPYPTVEDFGAKGQSAQPSFPNPSLPYLYIRKAAHYLREAFSLTLFGFDLIVSCDTNEVFIIDVNYFPSFRDFVAFPGALNKVLYEISGASERQEEVKISSEASSSISLSLKGCV